MMESSENDNGDMARRLQTEGYLLIPHVLSTEVTMCIANHLEAKVSSGKTRSDWQVPGTPSLYADDLCEVLLLALVRAVSQWSGRKVLPTYSYFRMYRQGDELPRHTDRESCELTLSLCLKQERPWPLYVHGFNSVCEATLNPGDALLYLGVDCAHWREPLASAFATQVFLHYVDSTGPYSGLCYDKRASVDRARYQV